MTSSPAAYGVARLAAAWLVLVVQVEKMTGVPPQASAGGHPSSTRRRRFGWMVAPLIVFTGLALMFYYALQTGDPSRLPSALIGKPVPEFALEPVSGLVDNGRPVPGFASSELASGRPSVVNFWASWCVPCVQEHPVLVEMVRRTGVDLYGINYKDQATAARRFLGHHGNPYRAVGVDGNGRTAIEWGVYGIPETFVVGSDGRIVYKHVGPITLDALQTKVIPAIEIARKSAAGTS